MERTTDNEHEMCVHEHECGSIQRFMKIVDFTEIVPRTRIIALRVHTVVLPYMEIAICIGFGLRVCSCGSRVRVSPLWLRV